MGEELGGHSGSHSVYATWRPDDRLAVDLMLSYLDRDGWLCTVGTTDGNL